jgi:SAM-dependent methyltransferase
MSDIDRDKWNQRYREGAYAERSHPSALLREWIERIPPGRALDVACGAGRNALYLESKGFDVDAVDISSEALIRARKSAQQQGIRRVNWLEHDLDEPMPSGHAYQLILVIRYVDLSLIRQLTTALAPGGFLLCEEHLACEADVIGPANPAFRVKPGDLRAAAGDLTILSLAEGLVTEPDGQTAALARLVARRS